MVKHGRRAARAEDEQDVRPTMGPTDQVFRMQLKPNVGADFKPILQTVNREYATRYLEQLGVSPAKFTLDLVQRNVPLAEKNIATTLRAKGHVSDELQLTVPPIAHAFRVPKVIHTHAILQLGLTNGEARAAQTEESAKGLLEGPDAENAHVPGTQFRHMASRYLHPFQLDTNLAYASLEELSTHMRPTSSEAATQATLRRSGTMTIQHQSSLGQRIATATRTAAGPSRLPSAGPGPGRDTGGEEGGAQGGWDPDLLRLEICEELLQDLVATPEVVLTLTAQVERALADWFRHQAPETLKGRLTAQEFQDTLELLTDDARVSFFITLFNFMHQEFVRGAPAFPHQLEQRLSTQLSRTQSNASSCSVSLSNSPRVASASFHMPAQAGQTQGLAVSHLQNLDKYDLGYKHWVRERQAAEALADKDATKGTRLSTTLSIAPKSHLTSAASHRSQAQDRGHPKRGVSFISKGPASMATSEFDRPTFRRPAPNSPGSDISDLTSLAGLEPATPKTPGGRSALRFAADPRMMRSSSPGGGHDKPLGRELAHSVTSRVSCRVDGDVSPAPTLPRNLSDAARRSMAHLPSMKLLNAAVSHATSGPMGLTQKDYADLQQARLFVLQKEFAILYSQARQSRAGMFFTLPVFLVTVRLCVHMLFTGLYRLWVKTREGHEAIQQMDAALEHLFDPHGYLQRNLSILQSSPTAVSVMTKHPHKSHEPERLHFADVSPLVRAAMNEPASAGARKLLVQGAKNQLSRERARERGLHPSKHCAKETASNVYEAGLLQGWSTGARGPLKTELSKQQQEALFRVVQETLKHAPPPVLTTLGDPAAAQDPGRDSWVPKPW